MANTTRDNADAADISLNRTMATEPRDDSILSFDSSAVPSDVKPMSTLCPVCREVYTEPKLLPCAHRFCRKCLVTWLESSRNHPTCPICTRKMISPSEYAKIVADVARLEQGIQFQSTGPEDSKPETVQHGSCSESEPVQASQVLSHSVSHTQDTATASGGEPATSENSAGEETVARLEQGIQFQSTGPKDPKPESETVQRGSCSESEPFQASQVLSHSHTQDTATASGGEPATPENSPGEKTSSQVSKAVVESLPTDSVMAALADSTKKLRAPCVCSVCPDQRTHAVDVCLDCGDLLCRSCTLYHSRLKATQQHQVKPITDLTPEQLARQAPEMCQTHPGQRMELYCTSHAQLVCLVCFAVGHSQCQRTETIADAAKRQRQVFQTRIQQLAETRASLEKISENTDQKQKELADSQRQVIKDISSLIDRITSALNARKDQLMKQAEEVPKLLSTKHQQEKELADELRWLISANHQLALDCLQNASDANFLRVGTLLERSTDKSTGAAQKVAAQKTAKVPSSIRQNAVLSVDTYHVLRIEELLRALGLVEIIEVDKDKGDEPKSFLPPATASPSAKSAALEDFNPFLCKPNAIGQIRIKGLARPQLLCKGHSDLLFVTDRQAVFSVCTSHPFQSEKIAALPYTVQAMAYVPDRLVMTTEKKLLLLLDVTKSPKVPITTVRVSTVYKGVTQGLEDTLVLSPVERPCCLDILTRDGILLRTLSVGHRTMSVCLCRFGDFVIASDLTRKGLHRVGLETGNREELSVLPVDPDWYYLAVDHKGRVYISDSHSGMSVADLKGQTMHHGIYCSAGIVVESDGKMFTFDPINHLLTVYDWNKFT